jgi:hypothetical protein
VLKGTRREATIPARWRPPDVTNTASVQIDVTYGTSPHIPDQTLRTSSVIDLSQFKWALIDARPPLPTALDRSKNKTPAMMRDCGGETLACVYFEDEPGR